MTLTGLFRSLRQPEVSPARAALPSLALRGPLLFAVQALWISMAVSGAVIWIVEAPLYYQAAERLQNTSGMVMLQPDVWRVGLQRLALAPSFYATQAMFSLSLMTWTMFATGLLIFVRRSTEWIALLISFTLVSFGPGIINAYGGETALAKAHPNLRLPLNIYLNISGLSYVALFLIPLLFPDGRFVPRWASWPLLILASLFALQSQSVVDLTFWPSWLTTAINGVWFAIILTSPIYRYWRVSDGAQREQTKWVLFGLLVALGIFLAVAALQAFIPWLTSTPERAVLFGLIGPALAFLGFSFLPISFAIAILRHHLWDIDLILNRTLVYSALTISVIAIYVVIVVGVGALFQSQGALALSLLATALVAVLFHPLQQRLQRAVNRLMYGTRDEPYAVLSLLGKQLEATPAPDAVLPSIVTTVAQELKLPYVAIVLEQERVPTIAASVGTPTDEPASFPLLYHSEEIGRLLLGKRAGEASFSPSEQRLLEDLARQAGVAAYAVRLTTDLQRSRERLVAAREEERRRLRRDLHDGLGPTLASMTLLTDAARNLLSDDPHAVDRLLTDLKREAQAATTEIRRVVYELRPPALDELGLALALREQAAQYSQSGLRVLVEAPDEAPPLPAAVDVAAYRIFQEAVTNIVRHAHAHVCSIRLEIDENVRLEIADDGCGLQDARPGVGLASMRERAEELGGTCTIESGPRGGVIVRAILPRAQI